MHFLSFILLKQVIPSLIVRLQAPLDDDDEDHHQQQRRRTIHCHLFEGKDAREEQNGNLIHTPSTLVLETPLASRCVRRHM